ncbi:MAG TPA: hypothetical protein PKV27_03475, partial [Ilumatobacteraceae bacterium]|nr:hypothetical protein [Ilumatobacteraceae bacterium]
MIQPKAQPTAQRDQEEAVVNSEQLTDPSVELARVERPTVVDRTWLATDYDAVPGPAIFDVKALEVYYGSF